jgi:hypothetical protein
LVGFHVACVGQAAGQFAVEVVSYNPGSTPASGFTTALAALGSPERFTGEGSFPGVVSPFNPPFLPSEIVSIGEGGRLTLRLSHYAVTAAPAPQIGVFTNVGLLDFDYPNGRAGSPPAAFGVDAAVVEVSENGVDWVGLNGGSPITFDVPTNGYTDLTDPFSAVAGSAPSDFQQPFAGSLASFDGLPYYDAGSPDILDLFAGSGGGTWLDISATGLTQVGFVRFSVLDDTDGDTSLNFELDAIAIAHAAVGLPVPEPATIILTGWALFSLANQRLRSRLLPAGSARVPTK